MDAPVIKFGEDASMDTVLERMPHWSYILVVAGKHRGQPFEHTGILLGRSTDLDDCIDFRLWDEDTGRPNGPVINIDFFDIESFTVC